MDCSPSVQSLDLPPESPSRLGSTASRPVGRSQRVLIGRGQKIELDRCTCIRQRKTQKNKIDCWPAPAVGRGDIIIETRLTDGGRGGKKMHEARFVSFTPCTRCVFKRLHHNLSHRLKSVGRLPTK